MASVITSPTYDPITTAAALADKYVAARRDILGSQTLQANASARGLAELGSAISAFQTSLATLTGSGKTMYAQSVAFSDTAIGSGSADATATSGTYAFFVKQLATASQVSIAGLTSDKGVGGELALNMGGTLAFKVDLNKADANKDGFLTPRELAAAINSAPGNASKVTASVVGTGTTAELVLTAKDTGANSAITLNTSAITGPSSLKANAGALRVLTVAKDAVVHVGAESGTAIVQASNTFTNIDGVTMTFRKEQAAGSAPVTVTSGPNNSATTANVQAFVDAYNKLMTSLSAMIYPGNPSSGTVAGTFATDGGVRALHDRLVSMMRPVGGASLAAYGIVATKDGTLEVRSDRLLAQLAITPNGLDKLIGSSSAANPSGIANEMNNYLKSWNDASNGQISKRLAATQDLQASLTEREALIDQQYDAAYQRYLAQFTQLQSVQSIMNSNVSLFDALFGSDKD
ncbi:flagellar filament capping protein FliD [Massilia sp. YIM B02443]|uniref:flagellar filament capping protein FliD n=1 Tax=Massilia sp. YIM B02443 TaxID=3050127 RepID=UPI0025B6B56F|nr:flagellar filament capping protein FliD [Massilia sp. YIM B02443]MDN4035972.1 flagellar filament capping protein FliD [Massilia sp. YIM B02443]